MSALDLRTVLVTYTVTGFVGLGVVLTLWWQNRVRYRALGFLACDLAVQAVAMLLIALRGTVPDWLSIVVANCLIGLALLLGYIGLERMIRRDIRKLVSPRMIVNYVVLAAFVLVMIYYEAVVPRLDARIINTSAVQLIIFAQCTYLLWRSVARGGGTAVRLMAAVFGGYFLLSVARMAAAVAGQYSGADYMNTSGLESMFALVWEVLIILLAYGLALWVNESLMAEVNTQEEKFAKAFQSVPNAVLITKASTGEVIEVNDAFSTISGYTAAEAIGSSTIALRVWATTEDRARVRDELAETGRVREREYTFRRKSGELFAGLYGGELISIRGEQFIVSSVADIEESKRAERQLRESQEQLLQAQKMEAVGQLAGGVAHDFNNLLGVILGYTAMASTYLAEDDADTRECLTQVGDAAERARALTGQILAFSRRQALRPVVLSVNEVVSAMEPMLRRTLGEDVELVADLDPALANVEADRHQLEQVLMNLVLNSRDAMSSGGILTIRTANLAARGRLSRDLRGASELGREDLVVLSVVDTGEGMDEATKDRVFEPFFTSKGPGIGSGLGMSVVYGVVKQSRGHIAVESQVGKGTTVHVYLPQAQGTACEKASEEGVGVGSGGTERILVVEDEAALRVLVARVLEGLGYSVTVAATAQLALEAAESAGAKFDLLLTDMVLPGATQGDGLATALCKRCPGLPVLYMSGYPRDSVARGGRLPEGIVLIEKPFTPHVLALAVREVLDKRQRVL
jgi:PAS domain S-box-containing protein